MVEQGVVTLAGEVAKRWMRHRAEDLVAAVREDLEIVNLIKVDNGVPRRN